MEDFLNEMDKICNMNKLLKELYELQVKFHQSETTQRFGQFVASNTDWNISQELLNMRNKGKVYAALVDMIQSGEIN